MLDLQVLKTQFSKFDSYIYTNNWPCKEVIINKQGNEQGDDHLPIYSRQTTAAVIQAMLPEN